MKELGYILPSAALGAILTSILSFAVTAPRYVVRTFRNKTVVEGEWHSYHCTIKSSSPEIRHHRWLIKRSVRGNFSLKCWDERGAPKYRHSTIYANGTAFLERSFLIITASTRKYDGQATFRLLNPISTNEDCVPGIWLSYDYDGRMIAGPVFFSRTVVTPAEADSTLKSLLSASGNYRLLGLRGRRK